MPTQTIQFTAKASLSLGVTLYPVGSTSAFSGEVTCTEAARGGVYTATISDSSGRYEVHVRDTAENELLGVIYVRTSNTAATFQCVEQLTDLGPGNDTASETGDHAADIARLQKLLNSGLSGQVMIDGQMVSIDPKAIRQRIRELQAMDGLLPVSGPVTIDLSALGQGAAV